MSFEKKPSGSVIDDGSSSSTAAEKLTSEVNSLFTSQSYKHMEVAEQIVLRSSLMSKFSDL